MRYLVLGQELGGKPKESTYYDDDGYLLYWKIAQSATFQSGIERLIGETATYKVVLVCGEEDPVPRHRRLLVGRVLREMGIDVLHICGDGRLETKLELESTAGTAVKQLSLFSEAGEEDPWRSTEPVSPRRP